MSAMHADALLDNFAEDAFYAYWDGKGDETAERTVAVGRDAIRDVLEAGPERRLGLLVSLRDDENWFVEAVFDTVGGPPITFAASAQLDAAGAITRCIAFECPPVEPSPTWASAIDTEPGSALAILERYFGHLIAGELVEACACFSEDCLYSHPPYTPGTARAEFRGREQLLEGLRTTRGPRSSRPEIVCCVQRGADCFIEGVVDGQAGPKGSFVSSASLDDDGLIGRYVAFYTSSRIPRR